MSPLAKPWAWRAVVLTLLSACTEPALDVTGKTCSATDPCPAPFVCSASSGGVCARSSTDGPAPHLVAAGAIACTPNDPDFHSGDGTRDGCRMKATAALVQGIQPLRVLVLGDAQLADGSLEEYQGSYDLGWGAFKSITLPAVGVHDYFTGNALGYFSYFGSNAGAPAKGYYSVDVAGWHLVALNSECSEVGGCDRGSAQEQWLRADLAASTARCTLAFWSHPRFASTGDDPSTAALWDALYDAHADVVLNGGGRFYERKAALAPDGGPDPAHGLRQFDVGTGGIGGFVGFGQLSPTTDAAKTDSFGVLDLTLRDGGYDFAFRAVAPDPYSDQGSFDCY